MFKSKVNSHNKIFSGNLYFDVAIFILLQSLMCVMICYLGFYISWNLISISFIASFTSLLIRLYVENSSKERRKYLYRIILILISIYTLSIAASSFIYDLSYDGQDYHYFSIVQIMEGWNVVRSPIVDSPWSTGYPKFSWVSAASLSVLTNNAETGKAFNLLYLIASYCILFGAYQNSKSNSKKDRLACIVCFIFTCNPVTISQLFTNYVDGQISSLFLCSLVTLSAYVKFPYKSNLYMGFLCLVLISNLKFSGLVYSGITFLLLCIFLLLSKDKKVLRSVVTSTSCMFLIFIVIGFNPYITNSLTYGNPIYPISDKVHSEFIKKNIGAYSEIVKDEARFISLFRSLTTLPANHPSSTAYQPIYNNLFGFNFVQSLSNYAKPDVRFNGFGILFIVSLIALMITVIRQIFAKEFPEKYAMFAISVILLTTISNPYIWSARYIPQLFHLPLFILVSFRDRLKKSSYYLYKLALITLMVNHLMIVSICIGYNVYSNFQYRHSLAAHREGAVTLYLEGYSNVAFAAVPYRLRKWNVPFEFKEKGFCSTGNQKIIKLAVAAPLPPICHEIQNHYENKK